MKCSRPQSRRTGRLPMLLGAAAVALTSTVTLAGPDTFAGPNTARPFKRIATFPVFLNSSVDIETVAEIVSVTPDGLTLVYTDSENEAIGFVDITDPANPQPGGSLDVGGEPTSVAVSGDYALVGINTSPDFVNPSGELRIFEISTQTLVRTIDLGGQPDSVTVSNNDRFAVIAIENERDEDLGDGKPPQLPGGFVVIIDLVGDVMSWGSRVVDLVGVPDLFPNDPEPEFAAISPNSVFCAVSMQENNHCAIINLYTGQVIDDFSFGTVDLEQVDATEDDVIDQTEMLMDVPREPDALVWTGPITFASADEGDLFGGSRGFTNWDCFGGILYEAGNTVEHLVTRLGHYPEGRSENKGNEPEGVAYASYGSGVDRGRYLFVGSERSSVVAVYTMAPGYIVGEMNPELLQVLPAGVAPEGLLPIPSRDLFVVAAEDDARDDKIRSSISIYERVRAGEENYPTLISNDRPDGTPIPWAALGALAADPADASVAYTIHDSFYARNRAYTIDLSQSPAVITAETELNDAGGVLETALTKLKKQLPGTDDFDVANLINMDGTINLDPEGITLDSSGTRWICIEGRGNLVDGVSDPKDRPFEYPNAALAIDGTGTITAVVFPPLDVTENQLRFGFEGLATLGSGMDEQLYVCWQREWGAAGDPDGFVRIGKYDLAAGEWTFAYYPLDAPESPNGGWVGLSDIAPTPNGTLAVIERDNQGGPDAAIKRIYEIDPSEVVFVPNSATPGMDFPVLTKTLVRDHIADGDFAGTGGFVPEKIEGLTIDANGNVWIINDNDGVDDNNGETQLLNLGMLFKP